MTGRVLKDFHYAFRVLVRRPAFPAIAVFTLAVGIGANTAVFSVANALLLRPLSYPRPDRLVLLSAKRQSTGERGGPLSWPRFVMLNERARSFSSIAAFTDETFNLSGRGDPEQLRAARVSWNFFDILGVQPSPGRSFRAEEDKPGGEPVILISHALSTRLFGAAAGAVGQHLALDGNDHTIVGILPADFRFGLLGPVDIVAPRVYELNIITPQQANGGSGFLNYLARLKPGVPLSQAPT